MDATQSRAWVEAFLDAIEDEHEALGELDRRSGDGDFGSNLRAARRHILAELPEETTTVGAPFAAVSGGFLKTGGTSGPLFGMWFRALARAGEDRPEIDLATLSKAVADGLSTVERLGGAKVGDKTMIDALAPVVAMLATAEADGRSLQEAMALAAGAARAGAESTATMTARRGRASYVGEVARGVVDPGAATVALLFERGATAVGVPAGSVQITPERDDA